MIPRNLNGYPKTPITPIGTIHSLSCFLAVTRVAITFLHTTMSGAALSDAERLKAEGNSLFVKSNFSGAYKKYSEAIKYDDKNAVLYCNRAACSLEIGRSNYPTSHCRILFADNIQI